MIDPTGRFFNKTEFLESATITGSIGLRQEETFYVKYGDIVGKSCLTVLALMLAGGFLKRIRK